MSNEITLQTEFVVPDDMDEENVRHVLGQFLGDLVQTDRFIEAKIVEGSSISDSDANRLLSMLSTIDDEEIDTLEDFLDAQKE